MLARERAPSFSERSGLVLTELLKTLKNVNKQAVDHEYVTTVTPEKNVSEVVTGQVTVDGQLDHVSGTHSDGVQLRASQSQNESRSDAVVSAVNSEFSQTDLPIVASVSERISIFGERVQPRTSIVIQESVSNLEASGGGSDYQEAFALPPPPPIPPPDLPPGVVISEPFIPPPPPPPAPSPSPVRMVNHTSTTSSHQSSVNDHHQQLLPARTSARENVFSELSTVLKKRFPNNNDDDVIEIEDDDSAPKRAQDNNHSEKVKSGIQKRKTSQDGRVYENIAVRKKDARSKIDSSVSQSETSGLKYDYHPYENFQIKSKRDINKNMNNVNLGLMQGLDVQIIDRDSDTMRSSSVTYNTIGTSHNKEMSKLSKPVSAHYISKNLSVKKPPSTNTGYIQEGTPEDGHSNHPELNSKIMKNVNTKESHSVTDIHVKESAFSKDTGGDKHNNSSYNSSEQESILKVSDLIQNFQGKKEDIKPSSVSPHDRSARLAISTTDQKTSYDGLSSKKTGPYLPDKVSVNIVELDSVNSGGSDLVTSNVNKFNKQNVLDAEIKVLSTVEKTRTNSHEYEQYDTGSLETGTLDNVHAVNSEYSNLYNIPERSTSSLQADESESGEPHSLDRFVTNGENVNQETTEDDLINCLIETGSVLTASYGTFKDDLIVTSSLRGEEETDPDRYSLTDVTSIQSDLSEPFIEEEIVFPSERVQRINELLNDANNDAITWRTASEEDEERDDHNVDEIATTQLNNYIKQNENTDASIDDAQPKGFRGVEPQPGVEVHGLELYHSASPSIAQLDGLGVLAEASDDGDTAQSVKNDNAEAGNEDDKVSQSHLHVAFPVAGTSNEALVTEHGDISLDVSALDKADSLSLHSNHSVYSDDSIHSHHSNNSVPIVSHNSSISEHLLNQSMVSNHSNHSVDTRYSNHSIQSHHSNHSEVMESEEQTMHLGTNEIHPATDNDDDEMENVIIFHQIPNLSSRDKITLGLNGNVADTMDKQENEPLLAESIQNMSGPVDLEIPSRLQAQPDDLISVSTLDFDEVLDGTFQNIGTSIDDEAELADAYLKDVDTDFDTLKLVKEGRGYLAGHADKDQKSETVVSTTVWNQEHDTRQEIQLHSEDGAVLSTSVADKAPQLQPDADIVVENDSDVKTQQPEDKLNLSKTTIVSEESASAKVNSVTSDDAPKRLSTMTEAAIATGMIDGILRDMYLSDSDSEVFSPTSKTFTTEAEVHAAGISTEGNDVTPSQNNMSLALDNDERSNDWLVNPSDKERHENGTHISQEDHEVVLHKSVHFDNAAIQKEEEEQNSHDYTEIDQGVIDFSMELSEGDEEVKDQNLISLPLEQDNIKNVTLVQETISQDVIADEIEASSMNVFSGPEAKLDTLQNESHQRTGHDDALVTSRLLNGHTDIEHGEGQVVSEQAEVKVNSLVKSWESVEHPHVEQMSVEAKEETSHTQSISQSVRIHEHNNYLQTSASSTQQLLRSDAHNIQQELMANAYEDHEAQLEDGNGHKIVSKQSSLVMVPDSEGRITVNQGLTNGYLHNPGTTGHGARRDSRTRRPSRDDPDVIFDNASLLRRRFRSPDAHQTHFDHLDTIFIEKVDNHHESNNSKTLVNPNANKPNPINVYEKRSSLKTTSKLSTRDDLTKQEDLPQSAFLQKINVNNHQAISSMSSSNGTGSKSSDLNLHESQKKDQVLLYMPGPQSFKHVLQLQSKHISPPGRLNTSVYTQSDSVNVDITVPRLNNESTRFQSNEQFKSDLMRFRPISPVSRNGSVLSKNKINRETGEPVYAVVNNSHGNIKVNNQSAELTFRNNVLNSNNITVKIPYAGEAWINVNPDNRLNGTGSPLVIDVDEGRMPTAYGDGLYKAEVNTPAVFYVDAHGLRGELSVQVDGPNSIAKCNVDPENDGSYAVTYIPVEVGMYNIQVRWNNKEIQGSPFHPKIVDVRQIHVIGGWQHYMDNKERVHLTANEEKNIPFDVKDAGPGHLTAEVRGPSGKIPVHIESAGDNKRTLTFTATEEGDYYIYVYWSEHAIVGSPFHAYARFRRVEPDPTKVVLSGRGLTEARVTEQAEFVIDGTEAGQGKPEVRLQNVHGKNIPVQIQQLSTSRYRCTYTAEDSGSYLLYITWNNRQLRGSPFKVNILPSHHPEKVIVSGEGLQGGIMGRDINVVIDTRRAGPGELTAHCMGPLKVAYCELEDMRDGTYKLNIRPQEPGRHILQIKYGGQHVLGSPYVLKIAAQPDASKVRVSGPGVEHGMLATYQSRFMVETRGAGAGQLTVRIRGPKGAFQVEMMRDSQKDRTILCQYHPTECGLYVIYIKWSGVDVPGSPFQCHIMDTVQELNKIMSEGYKDYNNHQLNRSGYGSGYGSWREEM